MRNPSEVQKTGKGEIICEHARVALGSSYE